MEKPMELRVCLRDLTRGTDEEVYTPVDWLGQHSVRVAAAMDAWLGTFGGTIQITGTPERGRVTVHRQVSDSHPIIDLDWYTESINP